MKLLYAVFGGTFDPFHYGHLISCILLSNEIKIKKIIIIPNNIPPHKKLPKASNQDRFNMIKLSTSNNKLFIIDPIELKNNQISYTIQTLKKIKKKINNNISLGFIIGEDNLNTFYTWHDWESFLKICHIIICPRKTNQIILNQHHILNDWINQYKIQNYYNLHRYSSGCIFFSNIPNINISSTQIRNLKKQKKHISKLVHWKVEKYINKNNLYNN
ncbi:nicotinate-nucleotide adenylyltransferase [Buchnera aphidicola]|uniref:nicotinate-nucleotide adenylyltransferase n=1 Tax=Buchnera aphidicola TaxID=9 RepID=UPI003464A337